MPSRSKSAEFRRGLIARASSGGNSSSSISISGWSRGTSMEALGFRLAMRGRSDRPRRSFSASETDDEEDTDMCVRLGSFGCGMGGTGAEEPWESVVVVVVAICCRRCLISCLFQRRKIDRIVAAVCGGWLENVVAVKSGCSGGRMRTRGNQTTKIAVYPCVVHVQRAIPETMVSRVASKRENMLFSERSKKLPGLMEGPRCTKKVKRTRATTKLLDRRQV